MLGNLFFSKEVRSKEVIIRSTMGFSQINKADRYWTGPRVMTPVRDQMYIPSCTAFAVCAYLSAKLAIGNPTADDATEFSPSELMECARDTDSNSNSVLFRVVYTYIMVQGLHREIDYPYFCNYLRPCQCPLLDQDLPKIGIWGWQYLEEYELVDALNREPITATIEVYPSLITHRGMDVWAPNPPTERPMLIPQSTKVQRHAVLLTGYGEDEGGIPYYIAKGAWSVNAWLNGYIRIRRDLVLFGAKIDGHVYWMDL